MMPADIGVAKKGEEGLVIHGQPARRDKRLVSTPDMEPNSGQVQEQVAAGAPVQQNPEPVAEEHVRQPQEQASADVANGLNRVSGAFAESKNGDSGLDQDQAADWQAVPLASASVEPEEDLVRSPSLNLPDSLTDFITEGELNEEERQKSAAIHEELLLCASAAADELHLPAVQFKDLSSAGVSGIPMSVHVDDGQSSSAPRLQVPTSLPTFKDSFPGVVSSSYSADVDFPTPEYGSSDCVGSGGPGKVPEESGSDSMDGQSYSGVPAVSKVFLPGEILQAGGETTTAHPDGPQAQSLCDSASGESRDDQGTSMKMEL